MFQKAVLAAAAALMMGSTAQAETMYVYRYKSLVTPPAPAAPVTPETPTPPSASISGWAGSPEDGGVSFRPDMAFMGGTGYWSWSGNARIANVPGTLRFNVGTDNGDGSWTIPVGDLLGGSLVVTAIPPHYSGIFDFTVSATLTESGSGATHGVDGTFRTILAAVADQPTLHVEPAT